jgi:O-antigen/teichoic acid export membrane protein
VVTQSPVTSARHRERAAASGSFSRVLKHAGVLLSGNAAASLLGLLSLLVAARHLGAQQFGTLVLIQTYALVIDRLINFQSWQAFIKYGSDAEAAGDMRMLHVLLKRLTLLDVASAFVGTAVALAGLGIASRLLGWSSGTAAIAVLFSLGILFNVSGVPTSCATTTDSTTWPCTAWLARQSS